MARSGMAKARVEEDARVVRNPLLGPGRETAAGEEEAGGPKGTARNARRAALALAGGLLLLAALVAHDAVWLARRGRESTAHVHTAAVTYDDGAATGEAPAVHFEATGRVDVHPHGLAVVRTAYVDDVECAVDGVAHVRVSVVADATTLRAKAEVRFDDPHAVHALLARRNHRTHDDDDDDARPVATVACAATPVILLRGGARLAMPRMQWTHTVTARDVRLLQDHPGDNPGDNPGRIAWRHLRVLRSGCFRAHPEPQDPRQPNTAAFRAEMRACHDETFEQYRKRVSLPLARAHIRTDEMREFTFAFEPADVHVETAASASGTGTHTLRTDATLAAPHGISWTRTPEGGNGEHVARVSGVVRLGLACRGVHADTAAWGICHEWHSEDHRFGVAARRVLRALPEKATETAIDVFESALQTTSHLGHENEIVKYGVESAAYRFEDEQEWIASNVARLTHPENHGYRFLATTTRGLCSGLRKIYTLPKLNVTDAGARIDATSAHEHSLVALVIGASRNASVAMARFAGAQTGVMNATVHVDERRVADVNGTILQSASDAWLFGVKMRILDDKEAEKQHIAMNVERSGSFLQTNCSIITEAGANPISVYAFGGLPNGNQTRMGLRVIDDKLIERVFVDVSAASTPLSTKRGDSFRGASMGRWNTTDTQEYVKTSFSGIYSEDHMHIEGTGHASFDSSLGKAMTPVTMYANATTHPNIELKMNDTDYGIVDHLAVTVGSLYDGEPKLDVKMDGYRRSKDEGADPRLAALVGTDVSVNWEAKPKGEMQIFVHGTEKQINMDRQRIHQRADADFFLNTEFEPKMNLRILGMGEHTERQSNYPKADWYRHLETTWSITDFSKKVADVAMALETAANHASTIMNFTTHQGTLIDVGVSGDAEKVPSSAGKPMLLSTSWSIHNAKERVVDLAMALETAANHASTIMNFTTHQGTLIDVGVSGDAEKVPSSAGKPMLLSTSWSIHNAKERVVDLAMAGNVSSSELGASIDAIDKDGTPMGASAGWRHVHDATSDSMAVRLLSSHNAADELVVELGGTLADTSVGANCTLHWKKDRILKLVTERGTRVKSTENKADVMRWMARVDDKDDKPMLNINMTMSRGSDSMASTATLVVDPNKANDTIVIDMEGRSLFEPLFGDGMRMGMSYKWNGKEKGRHHMGMSTNATGMAIAATCNFTTSWEGKEQMHMISTMVSERVTLVARRRHALAVTPRVTEEGDSMRMLSVLRMGGSQVSEIMASSEHSKSAMGSVMQLRTDGKNVVSMNMSAVSTPMQGGGGEVTTMDMEFLPGTNESDRTAITTEMATDDRMKSMGGTFTNGKLNVTYGAHTENAFPPLAAGFMVRIADEKGLSFYETMKYSFQKGNDIELASVLPTSAFELITRRNDTYVERIVEHRSGFRRVNSMAHCNDGAQCFTYELLTRVIPANVTLSMQVKPKWRGTCQPPPPSPPPSLSNVPPPPPPTYVVKATIRFDNMTKMKFNSTSFRSSVAKLFDVESKRVLIMKVTEVVAKANATSARRLFATPPQTTSLDVEFEIVGFETKESSEEVETKLQKMENDEGEKQKFVEILKTEDPDTFKDIKITEIKASTEERSTAGPALKSPPPRASSKDKPSKIPVLDDIAGMLFDCSNGCNAVARGAVAGTFLLVISGLLAGALFVASRRSKKQLEASQFEGNIHDNEIAAPNPSATRRESTESPLAAAAFVGDDVPERNPTEEASGTVNNPLLARNAAPRQSVVNRYGGLASMLGATSGERVRAAVRIQSHVRGHAVRAGVKDWEYHFSEDGDKFFHNARTGETRWDPPTFAS